MRFYQWRWVVIVGLGASLSGCDFIYRLLQKQGAEEKELIGDASPLGRNPTVEEIQRLLKVYGYDPGTIDGVLGLRTRDAIERFQKEQGLEETRFVDDKTWTQLSIFRDNGLIVENELNIALVQTLLQKAGYDPGAADGKAGRKTKGAILSFQADQGLKADGKVGYNTLLKLATFIPQPTDSAVAAP